MKKKPINKELQFQESELFKAKRIELKEKYGELSQYYWFDFIYEYYGYNEQPTAIKLNTLNNQMDKKHIIAILDTKGNVLKVATTRIPKGYLYNYMIAWDAPDIIKEMYENRLLPDIEILSKNVPTKGAAKKRKELNENKESLKRKIKIIRILE